MHQYHSSYFTFQVSVSIVTMCIEEILLASNTAAFKRVNISNSYYTNYPK